MTDESEITWIIVPREEDALGSLMEWFDSHRRYRKLLASHAQFEDELFQVAVKHNLLRQPGTR